MQWVFSRAMKTIVLTLVMVMMLGLSIKAAEIDEVLAYLQADQVDLSEVRSIERATTEYYIFEASVHLFS